MFKRALTWGGLAAAGGAAWTLLEFVLGFHTERIEVGAYTGFVAIVFPILAIVMALRRARAEAGRLSFGRGMREGLAVTAVLAVLGVLFYWVYFTAINPGFLQRMAAQGTQTTLMGQMMVLFVSSFIGGVVISAVASLLMRHPQQGASVVVGDNTNTT